MHAARVARSADLWRGEGGRYRCGLRVPPFVPIAYDKCNEIVKPISLMLACPLPARACQLRRARNQALCLGLPLRDFLAKVPDDAEECYETGRDRRTDRL